MSNKTTRRSQKLFEIRCRQRLDILIDSGSSAVPRANKEEQGQLEPLSPKPVARTTLSRDKRARKTTV